MARFIDALEGFVATLATVAVVYRAPEIVLAVA